MTVSLWRIASDTPDWTVEDLAGKGAAHKGGRWNAAGEHVTYTSMSASLAAWETRAHLGHQGTKLPFNRILVRIDVPDDVWAAREVKTLPLPLGWDVVPEGRVSTTIGSTWLARGSSALLCVPSVIINEELNVLVNPAHADAKRLVTHRVRRFFYDQRV
ncbi:RES family NAD+ phosphorylase [Aquincola tertiaricarbonis]|uniref:RES family NAD+ phosphorylase n=1 Tax=Aquincola tertiaricarbonis TaxID=391953 RepID=UPI000614CB75|nr:RES family NAD+ phosphorylase [Aquincola tertiaricarbonis]